MTPMSASHPDAAASGTPHCPIPQMTFGEVLRYLQGGYESPVHRAITTHLMYCNRCAEQLERIKAARRLGHHAMTVHMEAETLEDEAVEDGPATARLAAYLDGSLTTEEKATVQAQLRTSHQQYRHFAAVQQELALPVAARFKAPAAALAAVQWPVTAPARPGLLMRLQQQLRHWRDGQRARWLVPAFAVATCVLLVLTMVPYGQPEATILPLTALQGSEAASDQVLHGQGSNVTPEVPVVTLLIPKTAGERVRFTWPTLPEAEVARYRVEVYRNASETLLFPAVYTTQNQWEVNTDRLPVDTLLTMLVMAEYEDGGVRPVVQQQVQRAK